MQCTDLSSFTPGDYTSIQVRDLDLRHQTLPAKFYLDHLIMRNTCIQSLNIRGLNVSGQQFTFICEALRLNSTLTSLDASCTLLRDCDFVDYAINRNVSLTSLALSWTNITVDSALLIADALSSNQTLRSIDLSFNQLGPRFASAISGALTVNTTLTAVNLAHNQFGLEGARNICTMLARNQTLVSVNLCGNQIRSIGALYLQAVLQRNTTIRELDISENAIGGNSERDCTACGMRGCTVCGDKQLAGLVRKNTSLQTLRLDCNGLKESPDLAAALARNSNLTSLSLCGNDLSDLRHIARALTTNRTLQTIELRRANINFDGVLQLFGAFFDNRTTSVRHIDIRDNPGLCARSMLMIECIRGLHMDRGTPIEILV